MAVRAFDTIDSPLARRAVLETAPRRRRDVRRLKRQWMTLSGVLLAIPFVVAVVVVGVEH